MRRVLANLVAERAGELFHVFKLYSSSFELMLQGGKNGKNVGNEKKEEENLSVASCVRGVLWWL
jgi:hypothetical protein